MAEKIEREAKKLEIRLSKFLEQEKDGIEALEECIKKFLKLSKVIEKMESKLTSKEFEEFLKLRLEAIQSFSSALEKMSKAEHEKSHLLESYGALISTLEEHFQQYLKKNHNPTYQWFRQLGENV